MAANGISTLSTKQAKQAAKLALAAADRAAVGNPRDTLDITQLPTQYLVNAIVDNPNQDRDIVVSGGNAMVTFSNVGSGYFASNVSITFLANPTVSGGQSATVGNVYLHTNGAIKSFSLTSTGTGYMNQVPFAARGGNTYIATGNATVSGGLITGRPWV
jgi:hypothetical protein